MIKGVYQPLELKVKSVIKVILFLTIFPPQSKGWHFMQIVSKADTLPERLNPIFLENLYLCWGFMAQSTQWVYVELGQFI